MSSSIYAMGSSVVSDQAEMALFPPSSWFDGRCGSRRYRKSNTKSTTGTLSLRQISLSLLVVLLGSDGKYGEEE